MLLETGDRVVAAPARVVGTRVHRFAGVVHLLVVLQVVLASKRSPANITAERLRLGVNEDVTL